MTTKRTLDAIGLLLIVIFAVVLGQVTSAEAQKVHALLIILGNDRDIRGSVEKNESSMQTLLRQVSENCEVHMTIMKSTDETTGTINEKTLANGNVAAQSSLQQLGIIKANQVVQWIRDLRTEGEDTILVYYSGHGSMDAVGTHILNFDPEVTNDFVARDGLRNSLKQKKGRLKMLITDTCSNRVQTPPPSARVYAKVQSRERRYTKNLFLEHSGFVDITAAADGQYAWGNDAIGGYFTISIIGSFTADSDENQDRFLAWDEVFNATRSKTQKLFSETTFLPHNQGILDEIRQTTQKPIAYELPKRRTQYTSAEQPQTPRPVVDKRPTILLPNFSPDTKAVPNTKTVDSSGFPLRVVTGDDMGLTVVRVTYNGRDVYDSQKDPDAVQQLQESNGRLLSFDLEMSLQKGENNVVITAWDSNNQPVNRTLNLIYERRTNVSDVGTPRIHALLILIGDDPQIRKSADQNGNLMSKLLRHASYHAKVYLTMMISKGESDRKVITKEFSDGVSSLVKSVSQDIREYQVSDWLKDLHSGKDDTILIYYNGYGSMQGFNDHILDFDQETGDKIIRSELRRELEGKPGRLKMLITDTCSNRVDTHFRADLAAKNINPLTTDTSSNRADPSSSDSTDTSSNRADPSSVDLAAKNIPFATKVRQHGKLYIKNLLLQHAGILDITAAHPGQYAWAAPDIGGFFTSRLFQSITDESADTDQDGFLTWQEVFKTTQQKTKEFFKEIKEKGSVFGSDLVIYNQQETQKPFSYSLPRQTK